MLHRLARWFAIAIAVLLGVAALAVVVVYGISEAQLHKTYQIDVAPPAISSDAASIARGRHLVTAVSMCAANIDAPNLAGNLFLDIPPARLGAPNLTSGTGGIGGRYTAADWARTIRHGVRPDGTRLLFMPTANFYHLSDADLGAIIAYVKSMPPVDNQPPTSQVYPLGHALMVAGLLGLPAAEIDHAAPRIPAPTPGRAAEYGRYLTTISTCRDCHGANLSGGPIDEPGAPPAPNLTPAGALKGWSEADFINTIRTGVRRGGSQLRAPMPWQIAGQMTDDELGAIFRYLRHFKSALIKAGLPKTTRFHDLRHWCASLLIAYDVHPKAIQEILGHANITTTLNIYGHLLPKVLHSASECGSPSITRRASAF